jgi:hypothetical protein
LRALNIFVALIDAIPDPSKILWFEAVYLFTWSFLLGLPTSVQNWRKWLTAGVIGLLIPLLVPLWLPPLELSKRLPLVRIGLNDRQLAVIGISLLWIFVLTFNSNLSFWRRYRRTLLLSDPPVHYAALFATTVSVAVTQNPKSEPGIS